MENRSQINENYSEFIDFVIRSSYPDELEIISESEYENLRNRVLENPDLPIDSKGDLDMSMSEVLSAIQIGVAILQILVPYIVPYIKGQRKPKDRDYVEDLLSISECASLINDLQKEHLLSKKDEINIAIGKFINKK